MENKTEENKDFNSIVLDFMLDKNISDMDKVCLLKELMDYAKNV